MMKQPLVVLTGPTAVGKTRLSIDLAKAVGGEIISADSMQVYRYMDIGSAKIRKEEMEGVPHHLIDVLDPREEFHVQKFQQMAKASMEEIYERGHIPILTGGTGFYIQAVLYDIDFTEEETGGSCRKELEQLAVQLNLQGKVQFLGTRSDIQMLLEKADIFIHMPIWEEGFGIAVVEAMSAGMLCICGDSGAVPEIIRDGENGILIHDNNQAELQDCLEKVIGQEEDNYYQIRKKARETSERYSIDAFSRTLDSVLSNNGKVQI